MFSRVPLSCCSSRGLPRSGPHCPRCAGSATAGGAATRTTQPPVERSRRLKAMEDCQAVEESESLDYFFFISRCILL